MLKSAKLIESRQKGEVSVSEFGKKSEAILGLGAATPDFLEQSF